MDEAAKRGLLNLRRTPEALAQLVTKPSRAVLTKLGILTKAELESRYHVRLERYIKDMLIELHTLGEMIDTMVLPAVRVLGLLADVGARRRRRRGSSRAAGRGGERGRRADLVLQKRRDALGAAIEKAEGCTTTCEAGEAPDAAGRGRDGRRARGVRRDRAHRCRRLWPLPKYREILFPV